MSHLTVEQRYVIESLLVQNLKKNEIALIIGVSKSTVTREIQRNSDERSHIYRYKLAQSKSEKRKQEKPKKTYFTNSMRIRVRELIEKEYSPEQITGFCRRHNEEMVSPSKSPKVSLFSTSLGLLSISILLRIIPLESLYAPLFLYLLP